jgi:hypothetical protein
MRAITLKQPWAYAVCHLGKRVENRAWKPAEKVLVLRESARRYERPGGGGAKCFAEDEWSRLADLSDALDAWKESQ